ncbi:MAG: hypothetical protein NTV61_10785 [Candidatus Bathyarchaeota archaeon]|nr:hypothetical protein [Candidatus Bathyarchaeota archaeon]
MGRLADSSLGGRIHDTRRSLGKKYKMVLKEEANKAAFDALYAEWSNEDAAAIYQWGDGGIYGAIDHLNLNSAILNWREIQELRADYEVLLDITKSLSGE